MKLFSQHIFLNNEMPERYVPEAWLAQKENAKVPYFYVRAVRYHRGGIYFCSWACHLWNASLQKKKSVCFEENPTKFLSVYNVQNRHLRNKLNCLMFATWHSTSISQLSFLVCIMHDGSLFTCLCAAVKLENGSTWREARSRRSMNVCTWCWSFVCRQW